MHLARRTPFSTGEAPGKFVFGIALLLILHCLSLIARERVEQHYDQGSGLLVSPVFSLAQDTEGFIWIGTVAGLVRYDGSQMVRWARETIVRDVALLVAGPGGEVLVAENGGTLYRVTNEGVQSLPGPDGNPITRVADAVFDGAGQLWVKVSGGGLFFRDTGNAWQVIDVANIFRGERVRRVRPAKNNDVYILTDTAVWERHPDGSQNRLLEIPRPIDVAQHPDGSVFVLAWPHNGELVELNDGRATTRVSLLARPIDLVIRGGAVWVSFDRFLVSVRGAEPPDIIGAEDKLPSGGPLLVDHEGSLWLGTYSGLIQYPEPETTIWTQKDGLPFNHVRFLRRTDEGIWVTVFGGLARISREKGHWQLQAEKDASSGVPCIDSQGAVWAESSTGLTRRPVGGSFTTRPAPDIEGFHMCLPSDRGGLWLTTAHGLLRVYTDARAPEVFPVPPGVDGEAGAISIFQDKARTLWISTTDGRICHISLSTLESKQLDAWSCHTIGSFTDIFDIIQMPSGDLWAATNLAGLWRFHADSWAPHPVSPTLSSQSLFSLVPSPSGGVWLLGHGISMRVMEHDKSNWEVLERISRWQGLPGSGGGSLVEEPDGQLWITVSDGVAQIPARARVARMAPPRVRLVGAMVNGENTNLQDLPKLPNGSQVELRFAALSYRDRARLSYQYRLHADEPWIDVRDSAPVLRFVDLRAGDYRAEVRASLDGQNWTAEPARLMFQVLGPWYLRPWALAIFVLGAAALLYLAHRARVGMLLRLERQRAEIAMDLHDEMGSGLGSIGILSEIAAEDNIDRHQQRELAQEIAQTAGELGTALTEIVWTLRPGTTTVESLAYHLAERAGRLFPSETPTFVTEFPSVWTRVELSLPVRRNLLLIASEALHNAARHARARRVVLGLTPAGRGNRWRLWIEDDGCGIDRRTTGASNGMGLENMRRRARDIHAELSIETNGGRGTRLSIEFEPRAKSRVT